MKFKVGDKARVVYVRSTADNSLWRRGLIVTIHSLAPGNRYHGNHDCEVMLASGEIAYPQFDQLEPIVPEKGSWKMIEHIIGWNPTKEKVI